MTTQEAPPVATDAFTIPLAEVERELSRQLMAAKAPGESAVHRARLSNVVIFCDSPQQAERLEQEIPAVVAAHPARVLLLVGEADKPGDELTASVNVWCQVGSGRQRICSEQVTLRAEGHAVARLPFSVRGLLIGDLPTNLWWASTQPPAFGGPLMYDLAENSQQIIYDSNGWLEPARGAAATSAWFGRFEQGGQGRWRVVSDLNWRRLKFWRRILTQAFDPVSAPDALETISDVLVEHGPHAVIQAWLLVSWLASRLGWQVQTGRVQPGVEIAWQVLAPHGGLRIRIRRLPEGPSEVKHVRIACTLDGKPGAMNFDVQDPQHLAVTLEGPDAAPRTVAIQSPSLADLVGRQLSDRERDPAFSDSMAVAQVFAQSVLG